VTFEFDPIGVIRTPYTDSAPYQPIADDEGDFRIVLDPRYTAGLAELDAFRYIYVLYVIHRMAKKPWMTVPIHWAGDKCVGVFASRSPVRPNPIGLSIVQIRQVVGNEIVTSGLDVFDGTPVLDIKPYLDELDAKPDANLGWLSDLDDLEHLLLHIKGVPHPY
jgi:tRNA-Thr(GGU) m(6)t(6)A37 methyltransferase TsaA